MKSYKVVLLPIFESDVCRRELRVVTKRGIYKFLQRLLQKAELTACDFVPRTLHL